MRFFLCENDEIFTEDALRKDFDLHKADLPEFKTFEEFLEMCQSYNNGALKEIPEAEMRWVDVTEIYEGKDECQHSEETYGTYLFRVRQMVNNFDDICIAGINGVVISQDDSKVVQATGYTKDRGLWWELY